MNLGQNKKSALRTVRKVLLLFAGFAMVCEVAFAGQITASVYNSSSSDQEHNVSVAFDNEPLADALHALAHKIKVGISYNAKTMPDKLITYRAKFFFLSRT